MKNEREKNAPQNIQGRDGGREREGERESNNKINVNSIKIVLKDK